MRKRLLYAVLVLLVPGGIPAAAALYAGERIGRRRRTTMKKQKSHYTAPVSALKNMPKDVAFKIMNNPLSENKNQ